MSIPQNRPRDVKTDPMIDTVLAKIRAQPEQKRLLVAIAGGPASGKSSLAEKLAGQLGADAVVLPMDGFHLDNEILTARGLLACKGAPETFDAEGFIQTVARIASGETVFAPRFDRSCDLARAGAIAIDKQPIVIVEGNYLLLDQAPWARLIDYWTLAFYLHVSQDTLKKRCRARWRTYGLEPSKATERVRSDMKNAELIARCLVGPERYAFETLRR